jgi:endonuclease/exonuclease/phosphatase family metal-dependent hydrolase
MDVSMGESDFVINRSKSHRGPLRGMRGILPALPLIALCCAVGFTDAVRGQVADTPDVVIYNGTYPAWPSITSTPDGTLAVVWREGTEHMYSSSGKVMLSQSVDGGHTWSAARTIIDQATIDDRNPSIVALSDSKWLVAYNTYTSSALSHAYTSITNDGGATWSSKVSVSGLDARTRGAAIQLSSGTLVLPFYDIVNSTGHQSLAAVSTNGGTSWATYTVPNPAGVIGTEWSVVEMPNHTLAGIIRNNSSTAGVDFYVTTSSDEGRTWSVPQATDLNDLGGKSPAEIFLHDGKPYVLYDDYRMKSVAIAATDDPNLLSWDSETVFQYRPGGTAITDGGYPSSVAIAGTNQRLVVDYVNYGTTHSIVGYFVTVPEPSTMVLLALGAAIALTTLPSRRFFAAFALSLVFFGGRQSFAAEADVKVLTFNVYHADDTSAGRAKLVEIIQASGADIVGVQELGNSYVSGMAAALGWYYYQQTDATANDEQILSRYPILRSAATVAPASSSLPSVWGVQFEITPGHSAWLFNGHLTSNPYQPYYLRDGTLPMNEAAVVAAATSARGNDVTSLLGSINATVALNAGTPVFLTGDFNEPSHLDWTQAAANATPRPYDLKVAYPASTRVTQAGFVDAFRAVHPSELTDPGYTWTPGAPPPAIAANEVHDRIDFVYYSGSQVTATAAKTLSYPDGDISTYQSVPGYNSDHRAVLGAHKVGGLEGTTLTFSKLGANGASISQNYGDRAITSPKIQVEYSAAGGGEWKFWEGGNWNLGGAANLDSGGSEQAAGNTFYDLKLIPDAGKAVLLSSFDLLDWADNDGVGHTVSWQLLQGNDVIKSGTSAVPDSGLISVNTTVTEPLEGSLTLRLQHLSGSRNDLAIDNVAFFETQAVPEPGSIALLLLAGVALAIFGRIFRRYS